MENNSKYARAKNLGARLTLVGAALYLGGCGQPSGENLNQTTERRATVSVPAPAPSAGAATKTTALPIEQGIYGWVEKGSCAQTSLVFFYDGANYGYVSPAEPGNNGASAYSEVHRIARVAQPTRGSDYYDYYRGFTLVWNTENSGDSENDGGLLGIKAEGNGGLTITEASTGSSGKDMISQETYRKCSFAQLSSQMQATIRAERPQLAGGATASRPSTPAQAGFPPLPKGYYAVGTSCARAANAEAASDGPSSLARFDASALTWLDGGPQIQGFESLGNNRFRVRARSYGNGDDDKGTSADFVIRVTGPSTFVTEPGSFLFDRQESFTHCPTDTVPKAVRDWFEG